MTLIDTHTLGSWGEGVLPLVTTVGWGPMYRLEVHANCLVLCGILGPRRHPPQTLSIVSLDEELHFSAVGDGGFSSWPCRYRQAELVVLRS